MKLSKEQLEEMKNTIKEITDSSIKNVSNTIELQLKKLSEEYNIGKHRISIVSHPNPKDQTIEYEIFILMGRFLVSDIFVTGCCE